VGAWADAIAALPKKRRIVPSSMKGRNRGRIVELRVTYSSPSWQRFVAAMACIGTLVTCSGANSL
jgi:hypothetical protein